MARSNVFATSGKQRAYQVKLRYLEDTGPYFKDQEVVKEVVAPNKRAAGTRAQEVTDWKTTVIDVKPSGY